MQPKIVWSEQVQRYLNGKAPEPRRALWLEIEKLADWNGRENPPRIRHLEDELTGYARLRLGKDRIIFAESHQAGGRIIQCIMAGPRNTVYETFAELMLDDLAS